MTEKIIIPKDLEFECKDKNIGFDHGLHFGRGELKIGDKTFVLSLLWREIEK